MRYIIPVLCFGLCGCAGVGRIKLPGIDVKGVPDAGKPAVVAKSDSGVSVPLPQGSRLTLTKFEAIPATPDKPAIPAKEVTEIFPAGPTEYHKTESKVDANTGTVDTSIAAKRIEAQENRILLYAALGMLVGAGIFFWLHYPSPALMCAGGAVVLFLAWKLSGLPEWFWVIAVLAGAGAVGLYLGHHRGLHEPVPPKE